MKASKWAIAVAAAVCTMGLGAGAVLAGPPSGMISYDGGRTYVVPPKTNFGPVVRRFKPPEKVEASSDLATIRGPKGGPYVINRNNGKGPQPYNPRGPLQ